MSKFDKYLNKAKGINTYNEMNDYPNDNDVDDILQNNNSQLDNIKNILEENNILINDISYNDNTITVEENYIIQIDDDNSGLTLTKFGLDGLEFITTGDSLDNIINILSNEYTPSYDEDVNLPLSKKVLLINESDTNSVIKAKEIYSMLIRNKIKGKKTASSLMAAFNVDSNVKKEVLKLFTK